jgi:hypothetical protein
MKTFKTVSEFKKILSVGDKLHAIHHAKIIGRDENGKVIYGDIDMGIRPISIKQSNSFALKTTRTDGKEVDSWCSYPKASEAKIVDGKLTIYEKDYRYPVPEIHPLIPVLTYSFVD